MTFRPRQTHRTVAADAVGEERSRVLSLYSLGRQYSAPNERVEGWIAKGVSLAAATVDLDRELIRPAGPYALAAGGPANHADLIAAVRVWLFGTLPNGATAETPLAARIADEPERWRTVRMLEILASAGRESHPVELANLAVRALAGGAGGIGQQPRAGLAAATIDAAHLEISATIAASPEWRRITRVEQVGNYRPHVLYWAGAHVEPREAAEGGAPELIAVQDWPTASANPFVSDQYTEIAITTERLINAPTEIGHAIRAAAQAFVETLTADACAAITVAASTVTAASFEMSARNAGAEMAAEMFGGRRISSGRMRPIIAAAADVGQTWRTVAPAAEGDQAAPIARLVELPPAAAGFVAAVSPEFPPCVVTTLTDPARVEIPMMMLAAPAPQAVVVEGAPTPTYRTTRGAVLQMMWNRSDPVTWPAGRGARLLAMA